MQTSFKDSLVKRYLAWTDSTKPYDTNNYEYKIIRAYMENDTTFFMKMNKRMNIDTMFQRAWANLDSCTHLQKLSDMPVDEAYRFTHGQSFCPYGQKITISRSGSIINLHYIEFSNGEGKRYSLKQPDGSVREIEPYCVITKQLYKVLSMNEWEELKKRLSNADYWGLISEDHDIDTDGSGWQVEGYKNQQIHSVSRQCNCNPVFEDIGRYFLALSGEKTMCKDFF